MKNSASAKAFASAGASADKTAGKPGLRKGYGGQAAIMEIPRRNSA